MACPRYFLRHLQVTGHIPPFSFTLDCRSYYNQGYHIKNNYPIPFSACCTCDQLCRYMVDGVRDKRRQETNPPSSNPPPPLTSLIVTELTSFMELAYHCEA